MCILFFGLLAVGSTPQVKAVDGSLHRPLAEAGHRPSLLVFISHDCPICNAYAPELLRITRKYQPRVFTSFVYSEPKFSLGDARKHATAYGYTKLHLFVDPSGVLAKYVGATITPEAAVYDADGHLAFLGRIDDLYVAFGRQRPHATNHDLRTALDSVLNHHKVENARSAPVGCYIATN